MGALCLGGSDGVPQRLSAQVAVVVEDKEVVAAPSFKATRPAGGPVVGILDQAHVGELAAQHLAGPVAGGVIDDDELEPLCRVLELLVHDPQGARQ